MLCCETSYKSRLSLLYFPEFQRCLTMAIFCETQCSARRRIGMTPTIEIRPPQWGGASFDTTLTIVCNRNMLIFYLV